MKAAAPAYFGYSLTTCAIRPRNVLYEFTPINCFAMGMAATKECRLALHMPDRGLISTRHLLNFTLAHTSRRFHFSSSWENSIDLLWLYEPTHLPTVRLRLLRARRVRLAWSRTGICCLGFSSPVPRPIYWGSGIKFVVLWFEMCEKYGLANSFAVKESMHAVSSYCIFEVLCKWNDAIFLARNVHAHLICSTLLLMDLFVTPY